MSVTADQSILDLIRSPEGYRFARGVWVTHDLCTGALADLVLPALAGIGASERRLRRSAPSAFRTLSSYSCAPPTACRTAAYHPGIW